MTIEVKISKAEEFIEPVKNTEPSLSNSTEVSVKSVLKNINSIEQSTELPPPIKNIKAPIKSENKIEPIRCSTLKETLVYLNILNVNEKVSNISLIDYPTISSFFDNKTFVPLIEPGQKTLDYSFDTVGYIKGNVTLGDGVCAPYYIKDDLIVTNGNEIHKVYEVGRDGDILWKIHVHADNLEKVALCIGSDLSDSLEEYRYADASSNGDLNEGLVLELLGGKGIPLQVLHYLSMHVYLKFYGKNLGKITLQEYFINLGPLERRALATAEVIDWPEGVFKNGMFIPKKKDPKKSDGSPVRCINFEETLMYLIYSTHNQVLREDISSITKYPTLSKLFSKTLLPRGFDCRDKIRYNFNVSEYIKGNLKLTQVQAPYFVTDNHASESSDGVIQMNHSGDILWKVSVYAPGLKNVSVYIGGLRGVCVESHQIPQDQNCIEINLLSGKGIPLLILARSTVLIKCDREPSVLNKNKRKTDDKIVAHAHIINLNSPERRALANSIIDWPEGSFEDGYFKIK